VSGRDRRDEENTIAFSLRALRSLRFFFNTGGVKNGDKNSKNR
jgi:hypothetical protein